MKKALIIIACIIALALLAWGAQGGISLLKAHAITRNTDTVTVADTGVDLVVNMNTGPSYAGVTYRLAPIAIVTKPQIAVWTEDSEGGFVKTLYVTPRVRAIDRPAALPVWEHRAADSADAVSSATPVSNSRITADTGDAATVFVEINLSCDYNDYYRPKLSPGDPGYNTDYSGQPSLVYAGEIVPGQTVTLAPVGHGSEDGAGGELDADLSRMTTAMEILEEVTVQTQ